MGAGNVKTIYGSWSAWRDSDDNRRTLSDIAFRLLAYMALVTKDEDRPPLFWQGRESLAMAIGRAAPHTPADWRAVDRALAELRDAGAIATDQHSSPYRNARYAITLLRPTGDVGRQVNTRHVTTPDHTTSHGQNTRHAVVEHTTSHGATPVTPRRAQEEQGTQGLIRGVDPSVSAQPSDPAREPPDRMEKTA